MAETAWETNTEDSIASTEELGHHQPVPSQYKGGGPTIRGFRGRGLVVGGKGGLYLVSCRDFFWGIYPRMVSYPKEVING